MESKKIGAYLVKLIIALSILIQVCVYYLYSKGYELIFLNLIKEISLSTLVAGFLAWFMSYFNQIYARNISKEVLKNSFGPPAETQKIFTAIDERYAAAEEKARKLKENIIEIAEAADILTTEQRKSLVKEVTESVISDAQKAIYSKLVQESEAEKAAEKRISTLLAEISDSRSRLTSAIQALHGRASVSLGAGTLIALGGLGYLGVSIFSLDPSRHADLGYMATFIISRAGIVIAIELLAYFYLRIFKSTTEEIKYFQNELSNFDARSCSVHLSLVADDKEAIVDIAKKFASTERNFAISKEQTTVDLERSRIDATSQMAMLSAVADLFKAKKD